MQARLDAAQDESSNENNEAVAEQEPVELELSFATYSEIPTQVMQQTLPSEASVSSSSTLGSGSTTSSTRRRNEELERYNQYLQRALANVQAESDTLRCLNEEQQRILEGELNAGFGDDIPIVYARHHGGDYPFHDNTTTMSHDQPIWSKRLIIGGIIVFAVLIGGVVYITCAGAAAGGVGGAAAAVAATEGAAAGGVGGATAVAATEGAAAGGAGIGVTAALFMSMVRGKSK
jgi:hypothetical protein